MKKNKVDKDLDKLRDKIRKQKEKATAAQDKADAEWAKLEDLQDELKYIN